MEAEHFMIKDLFNSLCANGPIDAFRPPRR